MGPRELMEEGADLLAACPEARGVSLFLNHNIGNGDFMHKGSGMRRTPWGSGPCGVLQAAASLGE